MATYIDTAHRFYYDTDSPITASMLAESLLGLEGVIKRSTDILSKLIDTPIRDADVLITSIKFGSYDENFLIRFFFGKGRTGERNIEQLRKKLGLQKMELSKVAAIAILAAIAYGAYHFATSSKDDKASVHIENSFNNWGKELGMTKEELLALVQDAIRNKEDLKKQVVRLTHPAGSQKGGTITLDGDETLSIPSTVINSIPADYVKDTPDEPFKDFEGVDVVVRAVDLDRPAMGWAAIVPSVSDKRLPLQLAEGLDPLTVPIGKYTPSDITVIYKTDAHGNKTPKRLLLRKLVPKKGA